MKTRKIILWIVVIVLVAAIAVTAWSLWGRPKHQSSQHSSSIGSSFVYTNQPKEGKQHPISDCLIMDLTNSNLSRSDLRTNAKAVQSLYSDYTKTIFSYQPGTSDFSSELRNYYYNLAAGESSELNIYPIFKEIHMNSKFHSYQMKVCQFRKTSDGQLVVDVTGYVDAAYGSWWLDSGRYYTAAQATFVQATSGSWKLIQSNIFDVFTPKGFSMYFVPNAKYSQIQYSGNRVFSWDFRDVDAFLSGNLS